MEREAAKKGSRGKWKAKEWKELREPSGLLLSLLLASLLQQRQQRVVAEEVEEVVRVSQSTCVTGWLQLLLSRWVRPPGPLVPRGRTSCTVRAWKRWSKRSS